MQDLEVKDTMKKVKKSKSEIKKKLEESKANGDRNENTDIQEKVEKCTANEEDAVKEIQNKQIDDSVSNCSV